MGKEEELLWSAADCSIDIIGKLTMKWSELLEEIFSLCKHVAPAVHKENRGLLRTQHADDRIVSKKSCKLSLNLFVSTWKEIKKKLILLRFDEHAWNRCFLHRRNLARSESEIVYKSVINRCILVIGYPFLGFSRVYPMPSQKNTSAFILSDHSDFHTYAMKLALMCQPTITFIFMKRV